MDLEIQRIVAMAAALGTRMGTAEATIGTLSPVPAPYSGPGIGSGVVGDPGGSATQRVYRDNGIFSALGYGTGVGGAVTQATSKPTTVTLDALCGAITTANSSMAAGKFVSFAVNNNKVAATDTVVVSIQASGASAKSYSASVCDVAAGSFTINLLNLSGGLLSEAIIVNFIVVKGATS